jgi:hypothetical protein
MPFVSLMKMPVLLLAVTIAPPPAPDPICIPFSANSPKFAMTSPALIEPLVITPWVEISP